MPAANTGKCANAALKTTLAPALNAPKHKNTRADTPRPASSLGLAAAAKEDERWEEDMSNRPEGQEK
jgi:hypothetical protein